MPLSPPARELVSLIRRHRLDYDGFRRAAYAARRKCNLKPKRTGSRLPKLLPESSIRAFFDAVARSGDPKHDILFRFLLYTGLRISELVNLEVSDIDLDACTVRVNQGKGDKDRVSMFPEHFRLPLRTYLATHTQNVYLFESQHKTKYTPRRIAYIMDDYAAAAEVGENFHPHAFRHYVLTYLTREGVADAQIQLLSGHASKDSLAVYQHLALKDVRLDYQKAMAHLKLD